MDLLSLMPDKLPLARYGLWPKKQRALAHLQYFEEICPHTPLYCHVPSKGQFYNYQVGGKVYSTAHILLAIPSHSGSFVTPTIAIPGAIKSVSTSTFVLIPDDIAPLQKLHTDLYSLLMDESGMSRINAMKTTNLNLPSGYVFSNEIKNSLLKTLIEPDYRQSFDQIYVKSIPESKMITMKLKIEDGKPKCSKTPHMMLGTTLESLIDEPLQAHVYVNFRLVLDHDDKTANLRMDFKLHHIYIVDDPDICDADTDFGFEKSDDFEANYQAFKKFKAEETPTKK